MVLVLYLLVLVLVLPGFKIKVHYPDHISQNKISNKIQFDRCDLAYEFQLVFYELLIEPFFMRKPQRFNPTVWVPGNIWNYRAGYLERPDLLSWYESRYKYPTFVLLKNQFYS